VIRNPDRGTVAVERERVLLRSLFRFRNGHIALSSSETAKGKSYKGDGARVSVVVCTIVKHDLGVQPFSTPEMYAVGSTTPTTSLLNMLPLKGAHQNGGVPLSNKNKPGISTMSSGSTLKGCVITSGHLLNGRSDNSCLRRASMTVRNE
jgi:hypothetical protein